MISRLRFRKDTGRHLGLAVIVERAVETVDKFTSANCHQEIFERWISGLIAAFNRLHIPREGCFGVLRTCQAERIIERFILRLRQFRQAIEEVQPFMGGPIRRR